MVDGRARRRFQNPIRGLRVGHTVGRAAESGHTDQAAGPALKILIALLEQPGEVVTREELKRRIWPEDSFGDFDHAVNVAVAKLRAALGDSADVPR